MNLIILATLSLIFVLGWYGWSMGGLRLKQTWSVPSDLMTLSSDGKLLATPAGPSQKRKIEDLTLSSWSTVKLHSFPDGEVIRTLNAFRVTKLAFSPDNSLIAAGTGFGEIFIWRTDDGQLLHSFRATTLAPRLEPRVKTLIFSRDGRTLVTGVKDRVDAWRVADGQLRYSLTHKHGYGDLSPDGQILAVGSSVAQITFYRLSDGTRLRQLELYGRPQFSADGQLLAISYSTSFEDSRSHVLLYRLSDDTLVGALPGLKEDVIALALSPDGRYLAATYQTGGYQGSVLIFPDSISPEYWHLALWRLDHLSSKYSVRRVTHMQKKTFNAFTALAFSPDGKFLVSGGDDGIRLWRMPN